MENESKRYVNELLLIFIISIVYLLVNIITFKTKSREYEWKRVPY